MTAHAVREVQAWLEGASNGRGSFFASALGTGCGTIRL